MRTHIIIALCAVAALSASGAAKGSLTLENGEEHKGVISWSARAKSYVMKVGKIEQQFKETDVAEIDIEKPAAFDEAVAQVAKGQHAAAIPAKIIALMFICPLSCSFRKANVFYRLTSSTLLSAPMRRHLPSASSMPLPADDREKSVGCPFA